MSGEQAASQPKAVEREDESTGLSVQIGEQVPSIGLRASDGYLLNLRSYVGRQPSAFIFFAAPTADGAQRRRGSRLAEAMAAARRRLATAGVAVAGVTCDNERQQASWIAEQSFPYLLFSDERRSAVKVLGIATSRDGDNWNVERPWILVVGSDGRLRAVLRDPDPEFAADIVIAAARRAEGLDGSDGAPDEGQAAAPAPAS